MPSILDPPKRLDDLAYFVVRYRRESKTFEIVTPVKGESYDLGNDEQAWRYFIRVGQEKLGNRAMDAARAFGASKAIVGEGRAFGLDLTKVDIDPGTKEADRRLTLHRLLGEEETDEGSLPIIVPYQS